MNSIARITWLQWFFLGGMALVFAGFSGLATGYASGIKEGDENLAVARAVDTQTQFDLGVQDYQAGNYDLARQRFEYVVQQDPDFPGVLSMLAETLVRLPITGDLTAEKIAPPTPSPTPDTRPAEELFSLAEQQLSNQDWISLVKTIVSLRDVDPLYRPVEVDRMLFLGLRFGGIEKILNIEHYNSQLERAGWMKLDQGSTEVVSWSTWTFADDEGNHWGGTLIILDSYMNSERRLALLSVEKIP